jgi:hypothetical protein
MATDSAKVKFQFSLAQALLCMTILAVLLAAVRQGLLFAGVTAFILVESAVILVSTIAYLKKLPSPSLGNLLLRGLVCTALLCAVCYGWVPLVMTLDTGDIWFLIPFSLIVLAGAILGLLIAAGYYGWNRWRSLVRSNP